MEQNADVIVIGAGVIGLSCAWRVSQKGLRVTVIEQNESVPAASATSLGVLAYPTPLRQSPFLSLHRASLGMVPDFVRELQDRTGIPLGYVRCGSLEIIPTASQYEQAEKEVKVILAQRLKVDGQPAMDLLTAREAKHMEREIMSTEYGALYSRLTSQISVAQLLTALEAAAQSQGVRILRGTQVSGLSILRDKVRGVVCGGQTQTCAAVVAAAGSWTGKLCPQLKKYAYVEPVRGQALLLETPRRLVGSVIKWNKKYLVPLGETSLALGSTTEKESGYDTRVTPAGLAEIIAVTCEAVPAAAACSVVRVWSGLRPAAPDSKPIIGAVPGIEGLYAATGHYKTGFGLAPITALSIAELAAGEEPSNDISSLAPRLTETNKKKRKDGQSAAATAGDAGDDVL